MLDTIELGGSAGERSALSKRIALIDSQLTSISPVKAEAAPSVSVSPLDYAASQLNSKSLYMEVVKQLSKDSYGAGQVPISAEVL